MEGYAVRADEMPQKGCAMTRGEMRTFMNQAKSKQMQLRILCELNPGMQPGQIYEAVKDLAPGLKKVVEVKRESGVKSQKRESGRWYIPEWEEAAIKLHAKGWTDAKIAMIQAGMATGAICAVVGVSRQTVNVYRKRLQEAEVEG